MTNIMHQCDRKYFAVYRIPEKMRTGKCSILPHWWNARSILHYSSRNPLLFYKKVFNIWIEYAFISIVLLSSFNTVLHTSQKQVPFKHSPCPEQFPPGQVIMYVDTNLDRGFCVEYDSSCSIFIKPKSYKQFTIINEAKQLTLW